jgi:hypothetical protein
MPYKTAMPIDMRVGGNLALHQPERPAVSDRLDPRARASMTASC